MVAESLTAETRPKHEAGYWSSDDAKNSRRFFNELAIKLNFTSPEDWYNVKKDDVLREPVFALFLFTFFLHCRQH